MNYTKIKTFKGLDYGRSESTTNFIDKYKKFFLEESLKKIFYTYL